MAGSFPPQILQLMMTFKIKKVRQKNDSSSKQKKKVNAPIPNIDSRFFELAERRKPSTWQRKPSREQFYPGTIKQRELGGAIKSVSKIEAQIVSIF